MTSHSVSSSPGRTIRRTTNDKNDREWTSQECLIAEKWSLENFVKYRTALLCAQYYHKRYLFIAVPGTICAFLAAPGQWLHEATKYDSGISFLLAALSILGGLLQLLVLLLQFAEKKQAFLEQANFYRAIHLRIEKELDRTSHDLPFKYFCEILDFLDLQAKDSGEFIPAGLLNQCQSLETQLLKEKMEFNRFEFNTVYKARKMRRALLNEEKKSSKSSEDATLEPVDLAGAADENKVRRRGGSHPEEVVVHVSSEK